MYNREVVKGIPVSKSGVVTWKLLYKCSCPPVNLGTSCRVATSMCAKGKRNRSTEQPARTHSTPTLE